MTKKRANFRSYTGCGCLLILMLFSGCGRDGGNGDPPSVSPTVSVSPESEMVQIGDHFTRTIEVENMGNTFYTAFDLTYDPEIIEYLDATEGTFLSPDDSNPTAFQAALYDGIPGRLTVGVTRLGDIEEASGGGSLVFLTFEAVGSGTSALAFTGPQGFKDHSNQDVMIESWEDGSVFVE